MSDLKSLTDTSVIKQWRKETPGCAYRAHLNNAGAALIPEPVIKAIQTHLSNEIQYGGYEAADIAQAEIKACYQEIAELIGAKPCNIAIVENATVAVSQALSAFHFQKGDRIITTNVDYSSNQIMMLNLAKRFGVEIIRADDLSEGGVDPDSIRSHIQTYHPRLVLMTWIPTNSGLIQNAQATGTICQEFDTPFLVDACQAVGQLPVDVSELNCDFLAATSRKFLRGPRGLGFLYVSDRMLEQGRYPLFPDTHGAEWTGPNSFEIRPDASRFENWESPYALVLGLGAAARYANKIGIEKSGQRARELAAYTRTKLNDLPNSRVLDRGEEKCAIVTVAFDHFNIENLVKKLRINQINTSATTRNMGVIDMDAKSAESALRISPHYYNTTAEIDTLIDFLENLEN